MGVYASGQDLLLLAQILKISSMGFFVVLFFLFCFGAIHFAPQGNGNVY